MKLPTRVRTAVAGAAFAGAATVAIAAALAHRRGIGPPMQFISFTVLIALNWAFPILVFRREETEAYQLDEGFFVAMALVLPPMGTVLAFLIGAIASQIARRRPPARIAFNVGQVVTATGVALGVMHLVGGTGTWRLGAAIIGAAAFFLTSGVAVSGVIALTEEASLFHVMADGIGFRLLVLSASVALGLLAGLGASAHAWAVLLAVLPMGVLQTVLAGSLRARRDRERIDGLFHTAVVVHSSMRVGDVEDAITRSARELLQCKVVRIDTVPPGEDELGRVLEDGSEQERWVVASERRGFEPFNPRDGKVLDAIVAVGSNALENANLLDQIKHQAFHDALTGLPNQVLFEDRLSHALAQARRLRERVAVLFLDLDRFKKINDSLGHPAGNELLRHVADRIVGAVREGDTVARMGGDEFTILLSAVVTPSEATVVADKILEEFRRPFTIEGCELFVSPSIGIAVSPDAGAWPAALLKNADAAMYKAKERGRNCVEVYTPGMNASSTHRLTMEADLHNALDRNELVVLYQPQVDLKTGRIAGVEALVRWPHRSRGMVGPDDFIPLAEETGLIVDLDAWVLRTACAQGSAWAGAGLPPIRMAVNLSARDFERARAVETIMEALYASGFDPAMLELEVTESVALSDTSDVPAVLRKLRELGVKVAIDDFGTGYSMLGRLQAFPLDRLKIDKSFLRDIVGASHDAPIVAALIAMAHGLGLEVIAEGVETPEQQEFLQAHDCDLGQGYLLGRPVDAATIEKMLREETVPLALVLDVG